MKKWALRVLLAIVLIILIYIGTGWNDDLSMNSLKGRYANEESKFIPVSGMDVHYRDEGKGPTLLLIHGTASSLHTWDDWVEVLKKDFRIVRMDIPAFGLTGPNPDRDYTMQGYISFLDSFTSKLNLDTFYLAGNSLGGEIAWNYAHAHPEKIKKLILIDAAGYPREGPLPFSFKLATIPVINQVMQKVTPRRIVARTVREVYYDDRKINDTLVNRYFEMLLRPGNRQAYVDRVNQLVERPKAGHEKIKEIKTPTLIQWGKKDTWIPLANGEKFHHDLANSILIAYDTTGHVPMEETPWNTVKDARLFLLDSMVIK